MLLNTLKGFPSACPSHPHSVAESCSIFTPQPGAFFEGWLKAFLVETFYLLIAGIYIFLGNLFLLGWVGIWRLISPKMVECVCACAEVHTRLNTPGLSNALPASLSGGILAVFPFELAWKFSNFRPSPQSCSPTFPLSPRGNSLRMFLALLRGYMYLLVPMDGWVSMCVCELMGNYSEGCFLSIINTRLASVLNTNLQFAQESGAWISCSQISIFRCHFHRFPPPLAGATKWHMDFRCPFVPYLVAIGNVCLMW